MNYQKSNEQLHIEALAKAEEEFNGQRRALKQFFHTEGLKELVGVRAVSVNCPLHIGASILLHTNEAAALRNMRLLRPLATGPMKITVMDRNSESTAGERAGAVYVEWEFPDKLKVKLVFETHDYSRYVMSGRICRLKPVSSQLVCS